jgi:hypothetical protein
MVCHIVCTEYNPLLTIFLPHYVFRYWELIETSRRLMLTTGSNSLFHSSINSVSIKPNIVHNIPMFAVEWLCTHTYIIHAWLCASTRALTASLLFTSLRFTSLHSTSLHVTSLHSTLPHSTSLHSTSLHFTSLCFILLLFISFRFTSLAVLSVFYPGEPEQCIAALLLALLYLKVHMYCMPFIEADMNVLEEVSLYQIFFTFFCTLIIQV